MLLGASRRRDMMVGAAVPAGQVGKAFGFVSAGLSLGSAVAPLSYGLLIHAPHPDLMVAVVASLLAASRSCALGSSLGLCRPPAAARHRA